jgi:putative phosphoribosyl transferase
MVCSTSDATSSSGDEAMKLPIDDRSAAGRELARALQSYRHRADVLVLALPRGGVPVAYEVAESLQVPLDLMLVRKLGAPGQRELAMGAIASGSVRVLNSDIVSALAISDEALERVTAEEQRELARREYAYRGTRAAPTILDRCVILVDDGVATGATMRAAIASLRQQHPRRIVVATPVAPPDTVAALRSEADEVVCLETPEPFLAIGYWYRDFSQISDQEVRTLLQASWARGQEHA